MSFPPTLPNNPMFPPGYPQPPNVPPGIPGFPIPLGGLPLGALSMGVTVPAGVASISAPPIRNQNTGIIAAPPVMSLPNPAMMFAPPPVPAPPPVVPNNPPPLIQKTPVEPVKKPLSITTVFVGNITDRASDMLIRQLLSKCGSVHNWKRIQGPDGKLQAFGFCDYSDPESAMRAIRLLHDFSICEKKLIVRVDAKTQEKLDEYNKNENREDQDDLDEEDKIVKQQLSMFLKEHELELSREPESKGSSKRYSNKDKEKDKNEDLSELEMEDDKRLLIHREIDKFRDTYKKYDEEKEEEKRKKEEERFKRNERKNDVGRRSRSKERDRDDRGRSRKSRDRDRRSNRDRRSPSFDEKLERTRSESPVDEEELLLRRRRQEQNREKELSYQRRLRDWESREKRKTKEYERENLKEQRRKKEEESEKQKLKQFLQDYDDYKHDEKYYSGKALIQRQAERRKEIEQDEYEREIERKELEELKKKLSQEGHPDPDSEVRKRFNIDAPNEVDRLKIFMDEARSNSIFNIDEDSQGSASNLGGLIKTFGFAGMKISAGQGQENQVHISNGSGEVPAEKNEKVVFREESVSKHQPRIDSKRKRLTVSEVFSTNDDDDANAQKKKKRPPPNALLEDSNTDSNLSMADNRTGNNPQMSQEEKKIQIKNLIDKIPTSENEVFNYALDWDSLDNNLMERRIRPWIGKKIRDYIGEEEEALLDFICKKLLSKSSAQSLLDEVTMVLDDEALVFVVKLWRLLIFETEAKKLGLTKY